MSGAEGTIDTRPAPPIPPAEQFVADSPLEGAGFELSVPREIGFVSRLYRNAR